MWSIDRAATIAIMQINTARLHRIVCFPVVFLHADRDAAESNKLCSAVSTRGKPFCAEERQIIPLGLHRNFISRHTQITLSVSEAVCCLIQIILYIYLTVAYQWNGTNQLCPVLTIQLSIIRKRSNIHCSMLEQHGFNGNASDAIIKSVFIVFFL